MASKVSGGGLTTSAGATRLDSHDSADEVQVVYLCCECACRLTTDACASLASTNRTLHCVFEQAVHMSVQD